MSTFHVINFGCRASQADGTALKRQLLESGLVEAPAAEVSQVAVLNTCTVTATADAEVRQIIRRIHRANPACCILVTGCYAQRAPEEITKLPGVAWVVGNSHKHLVAELLKKQDSGVRIQELGERIQNSEFRILNPEPRVASPESRATDSATVLVGEITEEFHFAPVFPDDHTRPTRKVQDGCAARCSFCIIPQVRGPSRSLVPGKVIEQVRELERAGYQEIVLSGINLGSYGKNLGRPIPFLGLLERILNETTIARLRLSSIELMDVTPDLIRLVAREPRMARHFHVPLQSGSDRILRLMNRRYWTAQYAERLRSIHEQIPNCGIGADVMVGFPGETIEDHQASLRLVESLPFTYLHVFPYSARPGTAAAARPGHLNGRVIHERGAEMRALIASKRRAFLAAQIGQTLSAITLDEVQEDERVALSSNYLKIVLPGAQLASNRLLDVRIGRVHGGLLYGYAAS
ncbi:MAG: tRNA (N(6)-L-threonylcarbamoyladenosine(37)-C(2))-methylthiotransferase MtaB [Acidobacteriia bacterium]|nr:tRNA (N(6)-L-threonylcarbamoyladenosine(37)-C(2))-methylthiotransferase MtaB [Terriglobia bacterium]